MGKRVSINNIRAAIIKDFGEVKMALNAMNVLRDDEIKKLLTQAAQPLINEMRTRAPKDKGALARSIDVWNARKTPYRVWVGPSYKLGQGGRHAHLVEYGTAERVMKKGLRAGNITQATMQVFRGPSYFRPFAGKRVGVMPAQPFIRNSVQATGDQVKQNIHNAVSMLIFSRAKQQGFKVA